MLSPGKGMPRLSGRATGHQSVHRAAGLEVSRVWLQGQTSHVLTTLAILVKTPFRKSPATVGPSWHWNGEAGTSLYGNGEARPHSVGMGGFL